MNNYSRYTFDLYYYLLNFRFTLQYAIKRDHPVEIYNNCKKCIVENIQEGKAFGNCLNNLVQGKEKLLEGLNAFIDTFYSDNSTILIPGDKLVRVDTAQVVTLYEMTIELGEVIRDIVVDYVRHGMQTKELDPLVATVVEADERTYRLSVALLLLGSYQESFEEFQKVMHESQGQKTPQSNYIVQNELAKMTNLLRFSRQHNRCTDNETLDLLDDTNKILEMCEGRRQWPAGKNNKQIFTEQLQKLNEAVAKSEDVWRAAYQKAIQDIQNGQKPADPANSADPADQAN